jgi:hypothetical protein
LTVKKFFTTVFLLFFLEMEDFISVIQEKVSNKIYSLRREEKLKSAMWNKFRLIYTQEPDSQKLAGFVACVDCLKVYPHSRKSGTSNFLKHDCRLAATRGNRYNLYDWMKILNRITILRCIYRHVGTNQPGMIPATAEMKQEITNSIIEFVSTDIRPFEITNGVGFKVLAQKLIDIGATYGRANASTPIPHTTTVARNTRQTN